MLGTHPCFQLLLFRSKAGKAEIEVSIERQWFLESTLANLQDLQQNL